MGVLFEHQRSWISLTVLGRRFSMSRIHPFQTHGGYRLKLGLESLHTRYVAAVMCSSKGLSQHVFHNWMVGNAMVVITCDCLRNVFSSNNAALLHQKKYTSFFQRGWAFSTVQFCVFPIKISGGTINDEFTVLIFQVGEKQLADASEKSTDVSSSGSCAMSWQWNKQNTFWLVSN